MGGREEEGKGGEGRGTMLSQQNLKPVLNVALSQSGVTDPVPYRKI